MHDGLTKKEMVDLHQSCKSHYELDWVEFRMESMF